MPQLSEWTQPLTGHILYQVCRGDPFEPRSVRFIRHWAGPDPTVLWLGEGPELLRLLEEEPFAEGLTCFAAGDAPGLIPQAGRRQVSLVVTDLDLLELCERLSAVLRRRQDWTLRLLEASARRGSIQDVVDTAAGLAGGALFLLNAGGWVVFSGGRACLDSAPCREMLDRGLLSPGTALDLLGPDATPCPAGGLRCRPMGSEGKCWVLPVIKDRSLISHMVLFTPGSWQDPEAGALLELTRRSVSRTAAARDGTYWAGTDFRALLADLLSGKLTGEEEISRRFSLISRIPQEFCSFILVEPGGSGELPGSTSSLLARLEAIFPDSNAALYGGGVVLLLSRPDRDFQPAPVFDQEGLMDLLVQYDAYAAISNATSRRSMLRTNYLLTKSILQLGRALRACAGERIFFFEDYAEYIAIDLCVNSFSALMGHDDIIYLTHPEAVKLYRYDLAHRTNLLDVLYYYCLNNCSVSHAARAAYMHRNTFSARLTKVQALIKADLTKGEIQQRMVFSYKILRYYDRYAKINLGKRLGEH